MVRLRILRTKRPKVVASCQDCGFRIYEGEKVIEFGEDLFCNSQCLTEHLLNLGMVERKEAE